MNRRQTLTALAGLLGAPGLLAACGEEGEPQVTGVTPDGVLAFYSTRQFGVLMRFAKTLIPLTDTLGAVEVGAPQFMDAMMASWASPDTRRLHARDWNLIDEALNEVLGEDCLSASDAAFFAALDGLDERAITGAEGSPIRFNQSERLPSLSRELIGYLRQKSFVTTAYYWSEPGASTELQYELNPERIVLCGSINEMGNGRSWSH